MTLKRPLFMQADVGDAEVEYSALDTRALIDALVGEEGVLSGGLLSQRAAGANFSIDVAAMVAVIAGDDVTDQGKYLCQSTAVENIATFSTGSPLTTPPSGTRVHRVVAQVKDKLHLGTWSGYEWAVEILADTGSGTPSTPASAISLGTVSITAGQTSITDSHIVNNAPLASLVGLAAGQVSPMVTGPGFSVVSAWVDFTVDEWPAITMTVPPSGAIKVSVGVGNIFNGATSTSTIRIAFRISGDDTVAADPLDSKCVLKAGISPISASRTTVVTGLTPGGSITITPQWRISSGGPSDAGISSGQLIAEPIT